MEDNGSHSHAHPDHADQGTGHHHHHHHHGHQQTHQHSSDDNLNANRDYFEKKASEYDAIPGAIELAKSVTNAMLGIGSWDAQHTTVLDFACGTGLISMHLEPHCKQIIGVDISPSMVEQYNKKVSGKGISKEKMRGMVAELRGDGSELDGRKFDFIVCSAAYHHFDSISDITKMLSSFLKPGTGQLLVADFIQQANPADNFHQMSTPGEGVVPHGFGFSESDIQAVFSGADLEKFGWNNIGKVELHGKPVELFVAQGTKPAAS